MSGEGALLADALQDLVERLPFDQPPTIVAEAIEMLRDGAEVVKGDHLIGMKDVAALVGVDRTTASRWLRDGYLPAPFGRPSQGPVWLRHVIELFAEKHRASADAAGRRPVGTAQR